MKGKNNVCAEVALESWKGLMTDQVHAWYKGPGIARQTPIPERRFLGRVLPARTKIVWGKRIYSTYLGDMIPNDVVADRTFRCVCPFVKMVHAGGGYTSADIILMRYEIEVDGFFRERFPILRRDLKIKRNPDLKVPAVVEIKFRMIGTRFEKPTGVTVSSAILWHRSKNAPSCGAWIPKSTLAVRLPSGDFQPRHEEQGGCLDIIWDALGGGEVGRGF